MLHDARRERFPETFKFIAWLRTKPANERYPWTNCYRCACAQYWEGAEYPWILHCHRIKKTEGISFNMLALGDSPQDWTFGGLLERVEKKLAELTHA